MEPLHRPAARVDPFDIKAIVHDDFDKVRGAFAKPIEIDLEEMESVALLRSM